MEGRHNLISAEEFLKEHQLRTQSLTLDPAHNPAQLPAEVRDAAGRGWRIFPVLTCLRHSPATSEHLAEATNDLATLEEWAAMIPGCGWGLATGQESGVFALEMDVELGAAACAHLALAHHEDEGWPGQTLISKAGASVLVFFRHPRDMVLRRGGKRIEPGLTIHGEGDFVLLPPSWYRAGAVHAYLDPDATVAVAPQWLLDRAFEKRMEIEERPVPRIPSQPAGSEFRPGAAKPVVRAEVDNPGRKGAPVVGRAGWLGRFRISRRC